MILIPVGAVFLSTATYCHLPSSSYRFLSVNGVMYSSSSANYGSPFSSLFTIFRPSRPKSAFVLFLVFQESPFAISKSFLLRRKSTLFSTNIQRFPSKQPQFLFFFTIENILRHTIYSLSLTSILLTTLNILKLESEFI